MAIAEGQLRDHEARLGRPFPHDAYLSELTGLRDRLKAGLSGPSSSDPEAGPSTPVPDLAERIKALKAGHTIEAAPRRTAPRLVATAEEPVTARIRHRTVADADPQPEAEPGPGLVERTTETTSAPETVAATRPAGLPIPGPCGEVPHDHPAGPRTTFREHVSRDRQIGSRLGP